MADLAHQEPGCPYAGELLSGRPGRSDTVHPAG